MQNNCEWGQFMYPVSYTNLTLVCTPIIELVSSGGPFFWDLVCIAFFILNACVVLWAGHQLLRFCRLHKKNKVRQLLISVPNFWALICMIIGCTFLTFSSIDIYAFRGRLSATEFFFIYPIGFALIPCSQIIKSIDFLDLTFVPRSFNINTYRTSFTIIGRWIIAISCCFCTVGYVTVGLVLAKAVHDDKSKANFKPTSIMCFTIWALTFVCSLIGGSTLYHMLGKMATDKKMNPEFGGREREDVKQAKIKRTQVLNWTIYSCGSILAFILFNAVQDGYNHVSTLDAVIYVFFMYVLEFFICFNILVLGDSDHLDKTFGYEYWKAVRTIYSSIRNKSISTSESEMNKTYTQNSQNKEDV